MKTLKIYNIIASILIVVLSYYCWHLLEQLNDAENVLNQCETGYYKEIGIIKK